MSTQAAAMLSVAPISRSMRRSADSRNHRDRNWPVRHRERIPLLEVDAKNNRNRKAFQRHLVAVFSRTNSRSLADCFVT
jgi:hypothetical protein